MLTAVVFVLPYTQGSNHHIATLKLHHAMYQLYQIFEKRNKVTEIENSLVVTGGKEMMGTERMDVARTWQLKDHVVMGISFILTVSVLMSQS